MYEWLMGVEYDVYHDVVYFLLYLNCENDMKLLNYLVMLLVFIYVMCIYDVGEFFYMLLVMNCWWKQAVEKCGECMHSWLSHKFTLHMLSRMFTSILPLTGYLYPYSRWNYSRWQWCSVDIRGDDLGGELVPHVSRVGLGTLHV